MHACRHNLDGNVMADTLAQPYLDLVTGEHSDKPAFISTLTAALEPIADTRSVVDAFPPAYDLDTAVGAQLDVVGEWAGRSRYLTAPLTDVYFTFDDPALGLDSGTWKGPFDPDTGLVELPDAPYRTLLRAAVASNLWNGSVPSAYAIWDALLDGLGAGIFIVDGQDMSVQMGFGGGPIDAVTMAMLRRGYFDLKPAGVKVRGYFVNSEPKTPVFGFDVQGSGLGGFDSGSWANEFGPL